MSIHGITFDLDSGWPLKDAQVILDGTDVGASADTLGRFDVQAPGSGEFLLVVQLLGYRRLKLPIQVDTVSGLAIRIGMEAQAVALCSTVVCGAPFGCDPVEAFVRDGLTGKAPEAPLTLRVIGARDALSVEKASNPDLAALHIGMDAHIQRGPFSVGISTPVHAAWRVDGIEENECGWIGVRKYRAWLFPR